MRIETSSATPKAGPKRFIPGWRVRIVLLTALVPAALLAIPNPVTRAIGIDQVRIVGNYLSSFGADTEHLTIDVKHKHYSKLSEWRELALQRGQITSDLKEYVPATIRIGDQAMKADIRLKGEWTDHVNTGKWSLRVKIKGDKHLLGMKRMSLQHPVTRSYIYEWLYHEALEREDVANLRYRFVNVTINGKHLGVYALEENFGKELIESNLRREGVILRFNGEWVYNPFSHEPGVRGTRAATGIRTQHASEIKAYDAKKFASKPVLRDQFLVAHHLLQSFREGSLPASEVFDCERMAAYFAVSELLGTHSTADDWSDMRFLYDPVASRLEPIGVEGTSYRTISELLGARYSSEETLPKANFHTLLFQDDTFMRHYVAAVDRVSAPEYTDALLAAVAPEMKKQLRILHREWPHRDFSDRRIRANARVMRAFLEPAKGLHAYLAGFDPATNRLRLDLAAMQPMPIEVLEVTVGAHTYEPLGDPIIRGKSRWSPMSYREVQFETTSAAPGDPSQPEEGTLEIHYRLLGTRQSRVAEVFPWPRVQPDRFDENLLHMQPNAADFPFLTILEADQTIRIAPGHWTVDRHLIFPPGYTVCAGEGVLLDTKDGACILSYSPLRFLGGEDDPIIVQSSDASGQGLVVVKAEEGSIVRHTVFRSLSTPSTNGWQITGAVTFYRSPVELRNCEFTANDSEDGLNLIASEFSIEQSFFSRATSDALDADFCTGTIHSSTFHDIDGDGIDFSGSRIELADLAFADVADKAISIGEATTLTGSGIDIARSRIGIATKDRSEASLTGVRLATCEIAVTVFEKKSEYGPARLELDDLTLDNVQRPYVVETDSTLIVNGRRVRSSAENVAAEIYGTEQEASGDATDHPSTP